METDIKRWIKHHEGINLKPYKDSLGKLTIGWGRNLDENGISEQEANFMFENDFARCQRDLSRQSWYGIQPDNVKGALLNMCFNMGISRLLEFKNMIEYIKEKNYTKAALEALNSEWAKEVNARANDVALMMKEE